MKKLNYWSVGLLSTVIVLSSCNTKYYIPNTQNVPTINESGQLNATVAANGNQVEFQGAIGLSDAIALQANADIVLDRDEDNGNGGKGNFFEGGIGYYKNVSNHILFDTYALLGFGNMENHFPSTVNDFPATDGKISANLLRYGVQPSLSLNYEYFSIIGSSRFVNLNYSNISGSLTKDSLNQNVYLNNNKSNFLIEPAITIRAGLERLKFQLQYMKSFNLSNEDFPQDNELLSVGINFKFN